MFKYLSMLVLSFAFATAHADEKKELCSFAAENAAVSNHARHVLQVPPALFQEKATVYYVQLISSGISQAEAAYILEQMVYGWTADNDPEAVAKLVYKTCMSKKDV